MPAAKPLMIQGTGSNVGKSVVVSALGRILSDMGYRVAPFKAQNMALNSAVVGSGARVGEIGRSQALQARACRVEPTVDMNPVLLKPGEGGCQIIVQGRVWGSNTAREYGLYAPEVLAAVRESYHRLAEEYEIILIEGAGSPAEVNLLERDLPNHWIAREANAPVVLVGNIDPGGVFAALLGTWMIVPEAWRIRGVLLNQFRGDASLLDDGLEWLRRKTGVPTLGVIPWRPLHLPEEDAMGAPRGWKEMPGQRLRVAVLRFPHISNFTDFDGLARQPGVDVRFVWDREGVEQAGVIILPGTRSTVGDLEAMRRAGLDAAIVAAARAGTPVLGICGGYQMLGERILDPERVEAGVAGTRGLGLLPVTTRFERQKRTERRQYALATGEPAGGYIIQHGRVERHGAEALFRAADGDEEGCRQGSVVGTSLHGVLCGDGEVSDEPSAFLRYLLVEWRGRAGSAGCEDTAPGAARASLDEQLQEWSEHVRRSVDMDRILEIAGAGVHVAGQR